MFSNSRKRFHQLKEEYGYDYILLQEENTDILWTYDDDACALAKDMGIPVRYNANGEPLLTVAESDLDNYLLEDIDGEDNAFFLWTETQLSELESSEETCSEDDLFPPSAVMKVELLSESGD